MADMPDPHPGDGQRIVVCENGPYVVHGNVPLVQKTQVVSEYGEPLTWQKGATFETGALYALCRCGQSSNKPFCDCTHMEVGFDGTETAPTNTTTERQAVYRGKGILVKRDYHLCMQSGFCGNQRTNVEWMVRKTGDTEVRSQVMAMIERCPSGSFTYALAPEAPNVEPDLPRQVAVTTEMTDAGPLNGPFWVTGCIPIERSDGRSLEARNRVTLCSCGQSKMKPLCDGTHRPQEH